MASPAGQRPASSSSSSSSPRSRMMQHANDHPAVVPHLDEVAFAELEVKVRKMVLEVLQPTVAKNKSYEQEIVNLKKQQISQKEEILSLRDETKQSTQKCYAIDQFREELVQAEKERREHQEFMRGNIRLIDDKVRNNKIQCEQQNSLIQQLQRRTEAIEESVKDLQGRFELLKAQLTNELVQKGKEITDTKADIELKFARSEYSIAKTVDQVFEQERQLGKLLFRLEKEENYSKSLSGKLAELGEKAVFRLEVEKKLSVMQKRIDEARADTAEVQRLITDTSENLKKHFETASNVIAVNTNASIKDAREEFSRKLSENKDAQKNIVDAVEKLEEMDIDRKVAELRADIDREVEVVREDLIARDRRWKRDLADARIERTHLGKAVTKAMSASGLLQENQDRISRALELVFDAADCLSQLLVQDETDKEGLSLVGFRDKNNPNDGSGALRGGEVSGSSSPMKSTSSSSYSPRKPNYSGFHNTADSSTFPRATAAAINSSNSPSPRKMHLVTNAQQRPKSSSSSCSTRKMQQKHHNLQNKPSPPVISLDPRCLACSGQSTQILQGFKMACLHYKPSPVKWRQNQYTRLGLLEINRQILAQARTVAEACCFFDNSTQQIFGDGPGAWATSSSSACTIPSLTTGVIPGGSLGGINRSGNETREPLPRGGGAGGAHLHDRRPAGPPGSLVLTNQHPDDFEFGSTQQPSCEAGPDSARTTYTGRASSAAKPGAVVLEGRSSDGFGGGDFFTSEDLTSTVAPDATGTIFLSGGTVLSGTVFNYDPSDELDLTSRPSTAATTVATRPGTARRPSTAGGRPSTAGRAASTATPTVTWAAGEGNEENA
ncbi:unnamed protein product [Amoebophrya sp. A120]|nr:unnamed protein product [Amoebophrya sp. A120]|eukprot:GSA120T00007852001.1